MDAEPPSSPAILFEPLRLGLMSEVPALSSTDPGCRDRTEAKEYFRAVPLPLAPRLTLVGFSRAACPIDSAIGGGLTYVVPLRPSVFFVTSAGILAQPPYGTRPWTFHTQARADVVFDRGAGRSWSVGVKTPSRGGTGPGFTFGGIF